jgi:hypothetical protein
MITGWRADLMPEPRPRDPFRAIPANPIREDQKRLWPRADPDQEARSFNPTSLCFELPARVKFEAQTMYRFIHAGTGRVLRRFNARDLEEAEQEKAAWCGRVGRFAPSVAVVPE